MKRYCKEKDGQTIVKWANNIVIRKDGMQIINPTEEMILADGWVEYIPPKPEPVEPEPYVPSEYELVRELAIRSFNEKTDVGNEDALHFQLIVYPFDHYIGKALKVGQLVTYEDRIYRVRQEIAVVLADQYPSTNTAALYEVIEKEHTGEADDPIPYLPPMEIFAGKYYTENEVLYVCTRDSETALSHTLASLVGIYVAVA